MLPSREYAPQGESWLDDGYLDMLAVLSAVLQVYNIKQSDDQEKQGEYTIDLIEKLYYKMDKLEQKMSKLERLAERSAYNGR